MHTKNMNATLDFCDFAKEDLDNPDYRFTAKMEDVSIFLTGMLSARNITRTELATKLNWKKSRITRALSGKENLTLRTVYEIIRSAGFDFDFVARDPNHVRATQPWEKEIVMQNLLTLSKEFEKHITLTHNYCETAIEHCFKAEALAVKSEAIFNCTAELSRVTWQSKRKHIFEAHEPISKCA